ncbi:MAG: glycosyltransferase family 61 protein [Candidatus Nanopelagicales bacterium]
MSAIKRAVTGVRSIISDPVERRAYLSRLKFLAKGTEGVQAWSLEYREGLKGQFNVPLARIACDEEVVVRSPDDAAHNQLSHLYERRYVYRLTDTIVSTSSGATIMCGTPVPPFFIRESIAWPFESVLVHGLEIPEVSQVEIRFKDPLTVFPTTRNYYHWLIEDLPMVLRAYRDAPESGLLAYGPGVTDRHRTVASRLGMTMTLAPLVVRLEEHVLSGRACDSFFVHPQDFELLSAFGRSLTDASTAMRPTYPEKLYISRSKSRRPLADEVGLEMLLFAAGFEVVHLEDMPWIEQVRMFQRASVIVGAHGAGLANLVFAGPNTTVIELTVGYMFNRCFEWICIVAGHRYLPIEADSFPATSTAESLFRRIQDLIE